MVIFPSSIIAQLGGGVHDILAMVGYKLCIQLVV